MREYLKNNKGITLVVLVITVILLCILTVSVSVGYKEVYEINEYYKKKQDMVALQKAIENYYLDNGELPLESKVEYEDFYDILGNYRYGIDRNPNDNDKYYIIYSPNNKENVTNYLTEVKIRSEDSTYVVNDRSQTVYCVEGYIVNGELHYSAGDKFASEEYKNVTPRLPFEYQEVEWIKNENVGSFFILDKILDSPNNRILCKFVQNSYSYPGNTVPIMGFNNTYSPNKQTGIFYSGSGGAQAYFAGVGVSIFGSNYYGMNELEIGKNIIYNGNLLKTLTDDEAKQIEGNIAKFGVFGMLKSSTAVDVRCHVLTLYYLTFYDGDTLIADYIPCYRKSDDKIGLYDIVSKEFIESIGSFTKGNNF